MAYAIEFAPSAARRMESLAPALQRRVLEELEHEAASLVAGSDKAKKLKRLQVDDHRLVLLELHNAESLMVLKVADPGEMVRRLRGEPDPEPNRPDLTPPTNDNREPQTEPVNKVPVEEPAPPQADTTEPEASEPLTTSADSAPQPEAKEGPTTRPQGPGLNRLRGDFLDQSILKGESLLEDLSDLTLARQWGVRIAGSAGAYGLPEMADLGRELAEVANDDSEGALRVIQELLARAHAAKLGRD